MKSVDDKIDLRKRAEARRRKQSSTAITGPESAGDLLHELEVHQIELEMQNEELQCTQACLEAALDSYKDLFEQAPVGYVTLRRDGAIINANLTFASLLDRTRDQLPGVNLKQLVTRQSQDALFRHLRSIFHDSQCKTCQVEMYRDDGSTFHAQFESIVQGLEHHCLTVVTDITERRRQEALIHRQANYDPLTELPNRSLFLDRLAYSIRNAQREQTSLALFYIDLDNFKWINDTHGHASGDQVLAETARRFTACARDNDTVARLSGDEFCIILPLVSNPDGARLVAQKVLAAMEAPFKLDDGKSLHVTCSLGIAMYPKDCNGPDELLQSADIALYEVKRSCRGQFAFFSKALTEEILRRQRLGFQLRNAVLRDEFRLRYQPVIELLSGRVFGAEVLLRWQHPDFGLLPPGEFIPLAESNGTIVELGEWVLKQVCTQARQWNRDELKLAVLWVNISVRQCGNLDHVNRLADLLDRMCDWEEPPRIGFEITESDVLEFSESSLSRFATLHQSGVSLSVDDFGIGYSSLDRLLHLPFDVIKVDKSLVADIVNSAKSANLVKAVIALGHAMNTHVIAEGIETQEQLDILRELECDYGQGFHIAKPMTNDEFVDFLHAQ